MNSIKDQKAVDLDNITVEECAILLKKAFNSSGLKSLRHFSEKVQINYSTLKHYFEGHRKPPQEKWDRIWGALVSAAQPPEEAQGKPTLETPKAPNAKAKKLIEAKERACLLRCAMLLALDHLEYFKDALEADRDVLRETIAGKDVGYFTSLFGSLYDEEHLKAWKAFSK